ncbi:hypothetical protein HPB51_026393 [Rhipicephalus microplus]|uniref:Peptidase M13 N-terminal domain-containing protein n=1 Tax=Rhipicephalus microplus TaxID=6941 RepID=A0A9J6D3S9_RHIMP|nr:hypothetical protein HPB51_026393 [Rhipicephalus microplus]
MADETKSTGGTRVATERRVRKEDSMETDILNKMGETGAVLIRRTQAKALQKGQPRSQKHQSIVDDANNPDNGSPGKKKLKLDDDGNESQKRNSRISKMKSSSKQHNGETETQTYTLPVRTTDDYTKVDPEVTRIVHYCDTAFCSQEARYVESLVTSNQSPCVSFYEHVCNKWLSQQAKHPTGSESSLSQDSILQRSLARQLLSLIQDSTEPDLQTAAKLYSSCAVVRHGNMSLDDRFALEIMFERWEIRSWPRTGHKNLSNLSVWRFAAELVRDLDLATLFMVTVGVDPDDMEATILELDSLRSLFSDNYHVFEHEAKVTGMPSMKSSHRLMLRPLSTSTTSPTG